MQYLYCSICICYAAVSESLDIGNIVSQHRYTAHHWVALCAPQSPVFYILVIHAAALEDLGTALCTALREQSGSKLWWMPVVNLSAVL